MKQKGERKDKKEKFLSSVRLFLLLLTFLISFASSTYGQEAPVPDAGTAPEAGYTGIDYTETFTAGHETDWLLNENNFGNPAFVDNAQQYLGGLDGFSGDDYNIAQEYITRVPDFTDPQAQDIGNTFFSGDSSQVRSFLSSSTEKVQKAQEFFRAKFDKEFNLAGYHADFQYHADGRVTNGGKTISPEQLAGITGIKAVADGFCMTAADGRDNCMGGGLAGSVSYDERSRSFTLSSETGEIQYSFTPAEVREGEEPAIVRFQVGNDGSVRIEGEAQGELQLAGKTVRYQNHRDVLQFRPDGGFTSANARIITEQLIVDGAAEFNPTDQTLKLWDHGDSQLGNARSQNTLAIWRAGLNNGDPGAVSNGQQGGGEVVTVHLDSIPQWSRHSPLESAQVKPPTPEAADEMLRERARAIPPSFRNLGGSAEVTFGMNEKEELVVTAVGPVEVGFYSSGSEGSSGHLLENQPFFRGVRLPGQQSDAEFELKRDGSLEVDVRGKALYTDDQYGRVEYENNKVNIVRQGIVNHQEGASLALRRSYTDTAAETDVMDTQCVRCQQGNAFSITKNLAAGEPLADGNRLFARTSDVGLQLDMQVNDKGELTFIPSPPQLGKVAESFAEQTAILERYLTLSMRSPDGAREEFLRLASPSDSNGLVLHRELQVNGQKVSPSPLPPVDFTLREFTGNAIVVTSTRNIEQTRQLLAALEHGEIPAGLDFEPDEDLRRHIRRETRVIDITHLDNPQYRQRIEQAFQKQREYEQFNWQLRTELQQRMPAEEYAQLEFNELGFCTAPPDCWEKHIKPAYQSIGRLAYLETAARVRAHEARLSELEALQAAETAEGKQSPEVQEELKSHRKAIGGLRKARADFDRVHEQRQAVRQAEEAQRQAEAQREAIRLQQPTPEFHEAGQEAANAAVFINGIEKVRSELDLKLRENDLRMRKELQALALREAKFDIFGILSSGTRNTIIERHQQEQQRLLREKGELELQEAQARDQVQQHVAHFLAEGRPDLAARIVMPIDSEYARQIAVEEVSQLDSDVAVRLEIEALNAQGKRAEAARVAAQIVDPAQHEIAQWEIRRDELNEAIELSRQDQIRKLEVAREGRNRDFFDNAFDFLGGVGATVPQLAALPLREVSFGDLSEQHYLDAKGRNYIQRLGGVLDDAASSGDMARSLSRAYRSRDMEAYDRSLSHFASETSERSNQATARRMQLELQGISGTPEYRELQAREAYRERITKPMLETGERMEFSPVYGEIAEEFAGTPTAERAASQEDKSFYDKGIDQYAEVIVESSDVVLGVVAVRSAVVATRLTLAAGRASRAAIATTRIGARVGEAAVRTGQATARTIQQGRSFVRSSQLARRTASAWNAAQSSRVLHGVADAGSAVVRGAFLPLHVTGEVLGGAGRFAGRAFHTRGSAIDDALKVTQRELQTARQTGQSAEAVRKAEQPVMAMQQVERAHAMSKEVPSGVLLARRADVRVFGRTFGGRSVEMREAYVQTVRDFNLALDTGRLDQAARLAPRVLETGQRVKEIGVTDNAVRLLQGKAAQLDAARGVVRGQQGVKAAQAIDAYTEAGGILRAGERGEIIYDAPQREAAQLRQALQESGVADADIADAVRRGEESFRDAVNPASDMNTAERVQEAVVQQSRGAVDGVPVANSAAGEIRSRKAAKLRDTLLPAEQRIVTDTPTTAELRIALENNGLTIEGRVKELLDDRAYALAVGDLGEVRRADAQLIGAVPDRRLALLQLEEAGKGDSALARLLKKADEEGLAGLADDTDVLSTTTPVSLEDIVEEAVIGKIARERAIPPPLPEELAGTAPLRQVAAPEAAVSGIPPGVIDFRRPQEFTKEQLKGLEGKVLQLSDEGITVGDKTLTEVTLGRRLGAGGFGTVYCIQPDCAQVIKLPHKLDPKYGGLEKGLQELHAEIEATRRLDKADIAVARIHNPDPEAAYLIKDFVSGPTASNLILAQGKLRPEQLDALVELRRKSLLHGIQLDAEHGGNLLWDARNKHFVVIDPAPSSALRGDAVWERTFFLNDPEGYAAFITKLGDRNRLKEEAYLLATEKYLASADPAALAKFREDRAFGLRPRPEDYLPQNIIDDIEDSFNPVLRRITPHRDAEGRLVERATALDETAFRLRQNKEVKVLEERIVEEAPAVPRAEGVPQERAVPPPLPEELEKTAPVEVVAVQRAEVAPRAPEISQAPEIPRSLEQRMATPDIENLPIPERLTRPDIGAASRAKKIKENKFELDGTAYRYDPETREWTKRKNILFREKITDRERLLELEFARAGRLIPPPHDGLRNLGNKELDFILREPEANGNAIMDYLARRDNEVRSLLDQSAGVGEGYTVRQHTALVYGQFNDQARFVDMQSMRVSDDVDLEKVVRTTIALHDIGKPKAVAAGSTVLQHEFTIPILERELRSFGFSRNEVRIARNLAGHDILGELAKGQISAREAYSQLRALALDSGMQIDEFYELQKLFFVSDAGSYPFLRQRAFTQLEDGRLVPTGFGTSSPNPKFTELESLLRSEESVLGFSTRGVDLNGQESARRLFQANFDERRLSIIYADNIPGSLENIRLGQRAHYRSGIGRAYVELRSSRPQTISTETLEEIIQNIDSLAARNWDHGSTSRLLPQLEQTREKIGDAALLHLGELEKAGITPAGGELGVGAQGGANLGQLSGINVVVGNTDGTYHYAKLKGGFNPEHTSRITENLDELLRQYDALPENSPEQSKVFGSIMSTLEKDFDIFDFNLLLGETIPTARRRLQEERALLQQFYQYNPLQQRFAREGFPMVISTRQKGIDALFGAGLHAESGIMGRVSLADPEVIVFVERHRVPEVRGYLRNTLGINNPNVQSIESYDVFSALTDIYQHRLPDGRILNPIELRARLQSDPEFREFFKKEMRRYLRERTAASAPSTEVLEEAPSAAIAGRAAINLDLVNDIVDVAVVG